MKSAIKIGLSILTLAFANNAHANDKGGFAEVGSIFSSQLSANDPKMAIDGTPYKLFAISLEEGARLEIKAASKSFHPILNIGNIKGGENCGTCAFAFDAKSDEIIARINAKQSGIYIVRVNTVSNEAIGDFDISFNVWEKRSSFKQPIEIGKTRNFELDESDNFDENGFYFKDFEVYLKKGQKAVFDAMSKDFDPMLEFRALVSEGNKPASYKDDNGGSGNNSRLIFQSPSDGKYKLRISAKNFKKGSFAVSANIFSQNPLFASRIKPNALISEKLEANDKINIDGDNSIGKEFAIALDANKQYFIDARSLDFDIKTQIGTRVENNIFQIIEQDDDGGRQSNSFMAFKPTLSGDYIIRIIPALESKKYSKPNKGAFSLEVFENGQEKAEFPQKITIGGEIKSELNRNDARLGENNLYKPYLISLEKGQLIEIGMLIDTNDKAALDPFLEIGNFTEDGFSALDIDDDSGEGKNAKIKFLAPLTKDYTILARTAWASDVGKFTLKTKLLGPFPPPPPPIIIFANSETIGQLNEKSARFDQRALPYSLYSFVAEAEKTYILEATSSAFDISMGVKAMEETDDKYQTNDDGAGGTNAKLTIKPKTSGVQIIRIYSNNSDAIGEFKLRLSIETPITPQPIAPEVLEVGPKSR